MYDFADFGDVHEVIYNKQFDIDDTTEVLIFIKRMLTALQALHVRGYAHMDFKLENVLTFGPGLYFLSDFGNACHVDRGTPDTCGTNSYLPPEFWLQVDNAPPQKRDVFSLGVSLYHLISRSHFWPIPMWSNLSSDEALLEARKQSQSDVQTRYQGLEAHLERVALYGHHLRGPMLEREIILRLLQGMLVKDPEKRPSSSDLLQEFDNALSLQLKLYLEFF